LYLDNELIIKLKEWIVVPLDNELIIF